MHVKKKKKSLVFTPEPEFNADYSYKSLIIIQDSLADNASLNKIDLDMTQVEVLDPTGINLIEGLCRELKRKNIEFSIVNSGPEISKLLKFSGFSEFTQQS